MKDFKFVLTIDADHAFSKLKETFIKAPVLTQFDPSKDTIVETDSSGYAVGRNLSQFSDDRIRQPCAILRMHQQNVTTPSPISSFWSF